MGFACTKSTDREDIGANKMNQAVTANQISDQDLAGINLNNGLSQKLMLTISCKNLPNLDTSSKSDPFCVLWELKGKQRQKIGQTECILDNLHPEFVQTIDVNYHFEESQNFLLEVYDADDMNQLHNLQKQQLIGSAPFTLHQVVTKPHQTNTFQLSNPAIHKQNGQIKVTAVEKRSDYGQTECQFDVVVQKAGSHASDSLFFILFQTSPSGSKPVYKSENQKIFNGRFNFGRVFSDTDTLGNSNDQSEIILKMYQYNPSGNHKVVFQSSTNLSALNIASAEQTDASLSDGKMSIALSKVVVQKRITFLDYIFGGCEISLQVAVDFTASNGEISNPHSLHFMGSGQPNQYQHAIMSVGSILEQYDTDKKYPVFGFGGRLLESMKVSHCFALNGDIFHPECHGVQGILGVYQHAITKAGLLGPTYFAPILEYVNGYCMQKMQEQSQYNQQYTILLILTDGAIMDMQQSIDAIVAASGLPLSIVIVGVGSADFSSMEQLDADEAPLYSQRYQKYQERDIVQFVPFLKYAHDPSALAKEVLREIPGQLVQYFQKLRIYPNQPNQGNMMNQIGGALINQVKAVDAFFDVQKAQIVTQVAQQGMDPAQAQAFLDNVGIAEYNPYSLVQLANTPNYINQLRFQPAAMGQAQGMFPPPQQFQQF